METDVHGEQDTDRKELMGETRVADTTCLGQSKSKKIYFIFVLRVHQLAKFETDDTRRSQ